MLKHNKQNFILPADVDDIITKVKVRHNFVPLGSSK